MKRDSYPPISAPVLNAKEYLETSKSSLVGGRLIRENNQWFLSSEGVRLKVNIEANDLKSGDLVVLKLENERVVSAQLLSTPKAANYSGISEFDVPSSYTWNKYLSAVRGFFQERGFLEARTPTLVPSPGMEPHLEAFSTEFRDGKKSFRLFLPTSPEFHLKKMLVAGWTRVFEIKECFRNGFSEVGRHHQPEFLMLEWYRAYSNIDAILEDTKKLLGELAPAPLKFSQVTVRELFQKRLDFTLNPNTTSEELRQLAARLDLHCSEDDTWNDIYFRIFLEKIETNLGKENPVFVRDYPPSQAALARLTPEGWADRFELYWKGFEIANAYHELNDPALQRQRFEIDIAEKRRLGREVVPIDEEFLVALDYGMPPSGGIALGLERLFMALNNIDDISKVRAFPMRRL